MGALTYNYTVVGPSIVRSGQDLEAQLNTLGQQGWELIDAHDMINIQSLYNQEIYLFFKQDIYPPGCTTVFTYVLTWFLSMLGRKNP